MCKSKSSYDALHAVLLTLKMTQGEKMSKDVTKEAAHEGVT